MQTITIQPPAPFLNANDRLHYRRKAEITKYWRAAARVEAKVAKLTKVTGPVRIICHFRFPTDARRDVGNWYPTAKACVDGLVDAGVLKDDSDKHVIGPDMRREYPNGPARVTIHIAPLDAMHLNKKD